MTWTATGQLSFTESSSLTLSPQAVGDAILVEVIVNGAQPAGVTGGNCTWQTVGTTFTGTVNGGFYAAIYAGTVTAIGSSTATLSFSATPTEIRCVAQEFSTTVGTWILDAQGNLDSTNTDAMPSLTPSGDGDLYFGYEKDNNIAVAGSTSGYVYQADPAGDGMCYNTSCSGATQSPVWSSSTCAFGIAILLREVSYTGTVALPAAQVAVNAFPPLRLGVVQYAYGSTTGTSLTIDFPFETTLQNGIVVAACGFSGGSISSIALGSTTGDFTNVASTSANAQIWTYTEPTFQATSVTITTSASGILAWVYEVAEWVALDNAVTASGTGTSWSSGDIQETMPYGHVTIGVGATSTSTSMSPTASGWENLPSITGVGGTSGVSGYVVSTSPATYAYSGSAGADATWGAVTASFLTMPLVNYQPGWSGYSFSEHASYTGVTATFTMPVVTGGDAISLWVGLGNVYQTGAYIIYSSSTPNNPDLFIWTEMLPGGGYAWDGTAYPITTGDTLKLSMQLTETDWLLTIANLTEGWSFTDMKSALSINIGSINNGGAGPATWPYPLNSAEVIIEDEANANCANYGTVVFSDISTTPAISMQPEPIVTVNGQVAQYPGPFDIGGSTFTMYWRSYH